MKSRLHVLLFLLFVTTFIVVRAPGQDVPPSIDALPIDVTAPINSVTIYRDRASITRMTKLTLEPGVFDLKFAGLPEAILPETLQARVVGAVRVLAVEYSEDAKPEFQSPEMKAIEKEITELETELEQVEQQRELIKTQEEFLNAVTTRAMAESSAHAGTEQLDLTAVEKQMEFVSSEREKLLASKQNVNQRRREIQESLDQKLDQRRRLTEEKSNVRTTTVSIAIAESSDVIVELTYLVMNSGWEPAYNIRAHDEGSMVLIEYDAILTQRTGEDWDNVRLTLSTAQPVIAANPPTLEPWVVDVQRPEIEIESDNIQQLTPSEMANLMAESTTPVLLAPSETRETLADDSLSADSGPTVTFQLSRPVTVKTTTLKRQRTRITSVETRSKYVFVAVPLLTDVVYLRGELSNTSGYQFLPGQASVFLGQEYIGPTRLRAVAPQASFYVHFGMEPAVTAKRELVSKKTENTGLLSGGRRTVFEYRTIIENDTGRDILVELWDRAPISQSDEIQIELSHLSDPLSTDEGYIARERPQGMLKWLLQIPAGATGSSAYELKYRVRINRAKDVEMTPLPE